MERKQNSSSSLQPHIWNKDYDEESDLLAFTAMLTVLLQGGFSFGQIFHVLAAHPISRLAEVVPDLEKSILTQGEKLSLALESHPHWFNRAYIANIEMGESADLEKAVKRLYSQISRDHQLRKFQPFPQRAALSSACQNIFELLDGGATESTALSLVAKGCVDEEVRRALEDLIRQIDLGERLSQCRIPPVFPSLFKTFLVAHEAVGTTPAAFREMAEMLELGQQMALESGGGGETPRQGALQEGLVLQGRFELKKPLASGGLGEVYLALDQKSGLDVALKCLRNDLGGQQKESAWRFKEEVAILRRLNHDGIPRFVEAFEADGRSFLGMEFIRGSSLRTLLDRGREQGQAGLPTALVIRVGVAILKILTHIHSLPTTLIHRDIKPSNIILRETDEKIFLVDFGLAREISSESSLKSVVGTPAYSPLEQFQGKPEPRSDLYALGVTLSECLTGVKPTPLQIEPVQRLLPSAPPALARLIDRATRSNLEERYANAAGMLAELEGLQYLAEEPLPPVPLANLTRRATGTIQLPGSQGWRRVAPPEGKRKGSKRLAWIAAFATLTLLVSGSAYSWWTSRTKPPLAGPGKKAAQIPMHKKTPGAR